MGADMGSVHELIHSRDSKYQGAWWKTGVWIQQNIRGIQTTGYRSYNLIMIQNKMQRALASPLNPDHYNDIMGYAYLALESFAQMPSNEALIYVNAIQMARRCLELLEGNQCK